MKLSIITINYNNLDGLRKTAESVIGQTWRDFEWILIDGGSEDGSKEYIESIAADSNNNISFWCSEPDKGIYNAMNKGVLYTHGEYINFLNSGDVYYGDDILEIIFAEDHSSDIFYGNWICDWGDYKETKSFPFPVEIFSLYKENICHQAMFIRKEFQQRSLYDESYKIYADYLNWVTAAIKGVGFEYINNTICVVTMDGVSVTNKREIAEEYGRLKREFMPQSILLSMQRLEKYSNIATDSEMTRIYSVVHKGGLPKFITKIFLRIIKLFIATNDEY